VAQIDGTGRPHKHHRAGYQVLCRRTWEVGRIQRALRDRDVPGLVDELLELAVGHRVAVDLEPVDLDLMSGPLLGAVLVRPEQVGPARDPY
jgi:hypothetical protein